MDESAMLKNALAKAKAFAVWLWSFLGDKRTKNALLVILLAMTGFGMVAPETATKMRDIILALAF
jgi:hypothetical protein